MRTLRQEEGTLDQLDLHQARLARRVPRHVDARIERDAAEGRDRTARQAPLVVGDGDLAGDVLVVALEPRRLAHGVRGHTVEAHDRALARSLDRRQERLHERVALRGEPAQMSRPPLVVMAPDAHRSPRARRDGRLHDDLVPALGSRDRVHRGALTPAYQDRRNDRHSARPKVEQVALVRVPAEDVGRIVERRHRPDAVGPGEERRQMVRVVPRRPNEDEPRAAEARVRVVPRERLGREARAAEAFEERRHVCVVLGRRRARGQGDVHAHGDVLEHGR